MNGRALLSIMVVLVPGLVMAQPCGMGAMNRMAYFDVNGDGHVTSAELQTRRGEMFTLADGNQDGYLDAMELANLGPVSNPGAVVFRMQRHDRNGDRLLDRGEYLNQRPYWFVRADLNGDRVVSPDEGAPGYGRGRRCRGMTP
jgi:hypothetical protein